MQILKTKGVWRLVLFVAATYTLGVSADEVFTDASASRLKTHAIDSRYVDLNPGAFTVGSNINPTICNRLATMDSGFRADYIAGTDAVGNPVVPADVYPLRAPDIRPRATFEVPASRHRMQGRRGPVSAGEIDIDLLSGAVTYNGAPLNLASLSSLRRNCLRDFPDSGTVASD